MATAAELIARLRVDGAAQFHTAMNNAGASVNKAANNVKALAPALKQTAQAFNPVIAAAHKATSAFSHFSMGAIMGLGAAGGLGVGSAITKIGFGMGQLATDAVEAAAKIDALQKGLATALGGFANMNLEFARIRQMAKMPGIGVAEAAEGITRLVSAGASLGLAEQALMSFSNAVATVGGGREELKGVTLALTQILSKGKVFAEEINQINERVPQIRAAMIRAFGTADTEVLQKMGLDATTFVSSMTQELGKLPRVANSLKNSLENISDSWTMALARMGKSFTAAISPLMTRVGEFFDFLASPTGGSIGGAAGDAIMQFLNGDNLARMMSYAVSIMQNIPGIFAEAVKFLDQMIDGAYSLANTFARLWYDFQKGATDAFDYIGFQIQTIGSKLELALARTWRMAANIFPFDTTETDATIRRLEKQTTYKPLEHAPFVPFQRGDIGASFRDLPIIRDIADGADKIYSQFQNFLQNPPAIPNAPNVPGMETYSAIKETAQNTRLTARNLDRMLNLQRYAFGGGDLGALGVSPVEVFGGTGRKGANAGRAIQVNAVGAESYIRIFVEQIAQEVVLDLQRQRIIA